MKASRIAIIATIITVVIITLCGIATAETLYPRLTVVIGSEEVAPNLWEIECVDKVGHVWSFLEDEEPWNVGDIANLLMVDLGEDEETHKIIEVWFEGHLENTAQWIH